MPRWTFEITPDSLSSTEKDLLAQRITDNYVKLDIPAFLVNVFFHENRIGNFYSGGKTPPKTVFFVLDHAARSFPSEEVRLAFIDSVNDIVEPILAPKGIKWEYNIYEHPADNWRVNGMVAPVKQPELWKQWVERNEAVVYGEYANKK
ncbi:putative oxalocrotonate tautomerase [Talaromyces proteolyticus]|uniref:Oxalocrotonate tautomerase n=1 Tax=Talaromyces proteolyticus TaxID=1131652 RepID=A0AAD4KJ99_9EURO|nr:putative oxalocrotonate tautomerase [Talaromyces proteolyticus]KAH8692304.1 putative oxalocrotonate tautomerase [Talaromyces proteolyticus]